MIDHNNYGKLISILYDDLFEIFISFLKQSDISNIISRKIQNAENLKKSFHENNILDQHIQYLKMFLNSIQNVQEDFRYIDKVLARCIQDKYRFNNSNSVSEKSGWWLL